MVDYISLFDKACFPGSILKSEPSKELINAAKLLKLKTEPAVILGAGYFYLLVLSALAIILSLSFILFGFNPIYPILLVPLAFLTFYLFTEYPKMAANDKAMQAMGTAPLVLSQLSIYLRGSPSPERAMKFAAENSSGLVADDLKKAVWKVAVGKYKNALEGLDKVGRKWGKFSPAFQSSVSLIEASFSESDPKAKIKDLDRATKTLLNDTITKIKEYASGLHIPTLLLFSIGTIVPLMLISLFPIISFLGADIGPLPISLFLFTMLFASFLYSEHVLRKRPPSIGGIEFKLQNKSLPAAILLSLLVAFPGFVYLLGYFGIIINQWFLLAVKPLSTFPIIWGVGVGLFVYYYSNYYPFKAKREEVRKIEEQFPAALYHIRNKLAEGKPIEEALSYTARLLKGSDIAGLLDRLVYKVRAGSLPFNKALEFEKIDSKLIRSFLTLIAASLSRGTAAAASTTSLVLSYLEKLNAVDNWIKELLRKSLTMMKATALVFSPLVTSIIIVLFQMITNSIQTQNLPNIGSALTKPTITPDILLLIVGIYAIGLNFVLVRYVSRIGWGSDPVANGIELAESFPAVLIVFTATILATRILLLQSLL